MKRGVKIAGVVLAVLLSCFGCFTLGSMQGKSSSSKVSEPSPSPEPTPYTWSHENASNEVEGFVRNGSIQHWDKIFPDEGHMTLNWFYDKLGDCTSVKTGAMGEMYFIWDFDNGYSLVVCGRDTLNFQHLDEIEVYPMESTNVFSMTVMPTNALDGYFSTFADTNIQWQDSHEH